MQESAIQELSGQPALQADALYWVLDHLPMPVFVVSCADGVPPTFNKMNRAMKSLLRLDNLEEVHRPLSQLLPQRQADTIGSAIERCIASAASHNFEDNRYHEGVLRQFHCLVSPVVDEDGRVGAVVGMMREVSHTRRAEDRQKAVTPDTKRPPRAGSQTTPLVFAEKLRSQLDQLDMMMSMVMDDFEDLGDGKVQMLKTSRRAIAAGITQLDDAMTRFHKQVAALGERDGGVMPISFKDLCDRLERRIAARVGLSIDCDEALFVTDTTALQVALRRLLTVSAEQSRGRSRYIRLSVEQYGEDMLCFRFAEPDGPPSGDVMAATARGASEEMQAIRAVLSASGGQFLPGQDKGGQDKGGQGEGASMDLAFLLPGRLLPAGEVATIRRLTKH
ncbi:MAG: PAS domain-containing protein [Ahrensia sp.]|nr:PAS domain-containing protein [Ahrensia sp.]